MKQRCPLWPNFLDKLNKTVLDGEDYFSLYSMAWDGAIPQWDACDI